MSAAHRHDYQATGAVDYDRAFTSGIALNLGFVIVEYGYGVAAHSTALLADATHNLSDVAGPALTWGATRPPGAGCAIYLRVERFDDSGRAWQRDAPPRRLRGYRVAGVAAFLARGAGHGDYCDVGGIARRCSQ